MPPAVLVRQGRSGLVAREALLQEGIGFVEIRPEDLSALGSHPSGSARVLVLCAPLADAQLAPVLEWQAHGGAVILLGRHWPAETLLTLLGVRELPHTVSGGYLWASSPDLVLPAIAPDRPLQITGERHLYTVEASDTQVLALGSAHPSAAVTLDTNRDGFIDDEWYFCGPSISRISRGRPVTENLELPTLGSFAPRAAGSGDFTGDGFADDLLAASGDTFALLLGGVWTEPKRAPGSIRHVLTHPGPERLWTIHLFLGDGSTYVTSVDGGKTFGKPSVFAPAGSPVATDLSYSFDFVDPWGSVRSGLHVWSGGTFFASLGLGFGAVPSVADLGPRYGGVNIVRPSLGFAADLDRKGLRDKLTLVVGSSLYRMDAATGSFDYPHPLYRDLETARTPLVVRRGRTVAFLFDFEDTIKSLQQGRPDAVSPEILKSGLRPEVDSAARASIEPIISAFDDWVDYTAWDLPQADLHERLLRKAISGLLDLPLPRIWYWPSAMRSVASLSHDVETSLLGGPEVVRSTTLEIGRRSAAEGRKDTFFVLDAPEESILRKQDIAALEALGHHVTLHFNTLGSGDFSPASLQAQADELRALGASRVTGNRMHGLAWLSDLVPRALASDPRFFFDSTFGGGPGFSHCGSVLPYRLQSMEGELFTSFEEISCALMDVADASYYFSGIAAPGLPTMSLDELMSRARSLAKRNDEAFHGVLDTSFHPVVVAGLVPPIQPFSDALAAHAAFLTKEGIPSMSLEEVAAWWRLRRGLQIAEVGWSESGELTIALEAAAPVKLPTLVLPAKHAGRSLGEVFAGGAALAWTRSLIDGVDVAMLVLPEITGRTEVSARYGHEPSP